MSLDMPRAFIFDMDGVLIDNSPLQEKAWKTFIDNHGIKMSDDDLKQSVYGRRNKEILETVFGRHLFLGEVEQYAQEKEDIYKGLLDDHVPILPGLKNFLELIKAKSIPMAVATSASQEIADFSLSKADIRKYFRIIVTEKDVKEGKPSPEIYRVAAMRLSYNPRECFVFEDSTSGIHSATSAGCRVGVPLTTLTKAEAKSLNPEIIFENFEDPRLLKLI
jgi:HAD superfamily hydrolase (TIGR01509 family)